MKSTKTVLAVAIVIAGFAYAVGAGHPTLHDSLTHRCCGPQPEDIRAYTAAVVGSEPPTIIIPEVEGSNGFVLTDVLAMIPAQVFMVYQDTGEGPEEMVRFSASHDPKLNLTSGIPLIAGSTILVESPTGEVPTTITIRGYVY